MTTSYEIARSRRTLGFCCSQLLSLMLVPQKFSLYNVVCKIRISDLSFFVGREGRSN